VVCRKYEFFPQADLDTNTDSALKMAVCASIDSNILNECTRDLLYISITNIYIREKGLKFIQKNSKRLC
jgi:hypothetical protein